MTNLKTDVYSRQTNLKADVSVLKADVSTLKSDVSELKTDMSGVKIDDVAEFKGEIRSDMAEFKVELHAHVNRQAWMTISVLATLMVASVGLTGYFVKILA